MGLEPDGNPLSGGQPAGVPAGPAPGTPFKQAVSSRFFVFTAIGFVLVMGSQIGAIQHIYKLTGDRLGREAAAATAVAVLAGTSVVARICGGIAAIKVSLRRLTMALMFVQCIGLCVLALADTGLAILAGIIVLGSAMGNLLMLHPLILADAFGVREYPRIYGFGSLLMVIGGAGGPVVVGVVRDAFSYQSAFFTIAVIAVVGLGVYSFAGNPIRDYLAATPVTTTVGSGGRTHVIGRRAPAGMGSYPNLTDPTERGPHGWAPLNGEAAHVPQIRLRGAPEVWAVERT